MANPPPEHDPGVWRPAIRGRQPEGGTKKPYYRKASFYVYPDNIKTNACSKLDPMFVEHIVPMAVTQKLPIILIHGDFHSGQIWMDKPDGGTGWADFFLNLGYRVYLVDLPGVGRSSRDMSRMSDIGHDKCILSPISIQNEFTCTTENPRLQFGAWEKATSHTQWPGTGKTDDPVFAQYFASTEVVIGTRWERQARAQETLRDLLNMTGKAILVGEGTGSIMAFLATDINPQLVAGVISVEPLPPFGTFKNDKGSFSHRYHFNPSVREYGLADIPLVLDPPSTQPKVILPATIAGQMHPFSLTTYFNPADPRKSCLLQDPLQTIHEFHNLKKVPHAVVTSEASSHSVFDWATVAFMRQAGLRVDWISLEHLGIHGNGRLMFLERNSDDIANVLDIWIRERTVGHHAILQTVSAITTPAYPAGLPSPRNSQEREEMLRAFRRGSFALRTPVPTAEVLSPLPPTNREPAKDPPVFISLTSSPVRSEEIKPAKPAESTEIAASPIKEMPKPDPAELD